MMWIFLVIFGLIFLFSSGSKSQFPIIDKCLMHKWEYKEQPGDENTQYLQCVICGHLPGYEDGTEL